MPKDKKRIKELRKVAVIYLADYFEQDSCECEKNGFEDPFAEDGCLRCKTKALLNEITELEGLA